MGTNQRVRVERLDAAVLRKIASHLPQREHRDLIRFLVPHFCPVETSPSRFVGRLNLKMRGMDQKGDEIVWQAA